MDTLTHALSGALLSRAVAPAQRAGVGVRDCVVLGFFAGAFPDADVVFSLASPLAYLYHHRGITHSVILLPLWALLIAWVWSRMRRNPAGFKAYVLISAAAIAIHIVGDLITSFGTMILAPFSNARFEWSTTFIIDLWFSGIIAAGLLASWLAPNSRAPAIAALCVLVGYVGLQWSQRQAALAVGHEHARMLGMHAAEVDALPRPVSPFNWMIVIRQHDEYRYAFVNLRRAAWLPARADAGFIERLDAAYGPVGQARWIRAARFGEGEAHTFAEAAWAQEAFSFFRWFAAHPVLARVEREGTADCAWFRDLRFLTPGRTEWPFEFGVCRGADGRWTTYRRGDAGERLPLVQ